MAIRFQCGSCSQPIEVDDEWASRIVGCPYCRGTVTAPAQSTLADLSHTPIATPIQTTPISAGPGVRSMAAEGRNRLALVTLVLAIAILIQLLIAAMIARKHSAELHAVQQRVLELQKEGTSPIAAFQRASAEFYDRHGGAPPEWFLAQALLYFSAGLMWLAAVICGGIAVLRPHRRGLAAASLITAGLVPVVFCCSGGLGMA